MIYQNSIISSNAFSLLETRRSEQEEWRVRTDGSLAALTEGARGLVRRANAQQKTLDETNTKQEDLEVSITSAQKVGEAATASALAPVRVRGGRNEGRGVN